MRIRIIAPVSFVPGSGMEKFGSGIQYKHPGFALFIGHLYIKRDNPLSIERHMFLIYGGFAVLMWLIACECAFTTALEPVHEVVQRLLLY